MGDGRHVAAGVISWLLTGWMITVTANAVEVTAAAELTTEYTNNTLRTPDNKIGEWRFEPGVAFTATEDTASLKMDVDYGYIRRIYQKDIWIDENILGGTADIVWQPVAERLDFFLRNTLSQSTIRALQVETQNNRQQVSTTEVGSTLRFQPRSGDDLELEYSYVDIRTDETRTDSQRHNGTGRYLLGLSESRMAILQGTYSDISYDGLFPDAEYVIVSIGYTQTSNVLDLELAIGHNWYERTGRGKNDDPAYNAAITWRARAGTTFGLTALHRITDQSQNLAEGGGSAAENTAVNAAFKETIGNLSLTQELGRTTTLTLAGYWDRQEYADDIPLSNERVGGRLSLERQLNPTTDFNLYADFSNRDYEDRDDQDELRSGFDVSHRIGRSLSFTWGVRYDKRTAVTTRGYDEWIGSMQLYYTFLGAQR